MDDDADRTNLSNLVLRFAAAGKPVEFRFAEGMVSKRGWVVTGDPAGE